VLESPYEIEVDNDMEGKNEVPLSEARLAELKSWNTPTIYNGWEQITTSDAGKDGFNVEECRDFMPEMGAMIGYAVTVVIEPSKAEHRRHNPTAWSEYRRYVASVPGPKIVVVQDLDKPGTFGSFWGEVNSNIHKALGCVGAITDGGIRDLRRCGASDSRRSLACCASGMRTLIRFDGIVRWRCSAEPSGRDS